MNEGLGVEPPRKRTAREREVEDNGGNGGASASSGNVAMNMLENREDELRAVLAHQLELEIALRKRIAKVVEARIQWAERLKTTLMQGSGEQAAADPTRFKQRAFEEFRAAHAPLDLDSHTVHPRGSFLLRSLPDTLSQTPYPVHASTSTSKQLYLVPPTSESTSFPPLLLLTCPYPSCPTPHPSTTLQGLLNHARITHGPSYAFASHDEFIASPGATSVLDAKLEPERYARVLSEGVRISAGGVRGLRALLEGAFGGGEGKMGLGFSADTPALAGLLGRRTRKGEIRAFGQDEEVDVERVDGNKAGKEKWREYGIWVPKRKEKPEVDAFMDEPEDTGTAIKDKSLPSPSALVRSDGSATKPPVEHTQSFSRFYIKKRVVVSDWSQSLRRSQIQPDGPTHRWMIRLTAPSYSDHITTFLSTVRIQCASVPPLFEDTITCSTAPFVISRMSSVPFLARVTLVFADERTKDVTVTQWVDLDPMRAGRPILGAEQIFDVELDRNAQPLPVDTSSDNISHSVLWAEDRGVSDKATQDRMLQSTPPAVKPVPSAIKYAVGTTTTLPQETPQEESLPEDKLKPPHERLIPILSKLRSRLPLTQEDSKSGIVPSVAYTCFPTHSKLLEAPHGRRKAVEWQYTRTILKMLTAECASYDADLDPKLVESLDVAQLHTYLATEKVFPRPEPQALMIKLEEETETAPLPPTVHLAHGLPRYCGVCGLNVLSHPPTPYPVGTSGFACSPPKSSHHPMCDIGLWTTSRHIRNTIQRINPIYGLITTQGARESLRGASQLVECASPQMTLAFHALTELWGLKTFGYSAKRRNPATTLDGLHAVETRFPLELLGIDAPHVDRTLAPHALLALVAEIFIKRLVREALRARAETLGGLAGGIGPNLLTTAHISRALMDGRGSDGWLPLMAVARIGMTHVDSV